MISAPIKAVEDLDFWRRRLNAALALGRPLHAAIYDCSPETWERAQKESKELMARYLRPGEKILDAGCGFGSLYELLPEGVTKYRGIDISPDLIDIARQRHPRANFEIGDLNDLSEYRSKSYDWVICRSVEGMIIENKGSRAWDVMEKELCRVGERVLLWGYDQVERDHRLPLDPPKKKTKEQA